MTSRVPPLHWHRLVRRLTGGTVACFVVMALVAAGAGRAASAQMPAGALDGDERERLRSEIREAHQRRMLSGHERGDHRARPGEPGAGPYSPATPALPAHHAMPPGGAPGSRMSQLSEQEREQLRQQLREHRTHGAVQPTGPRRHSP